MPAHLKLCSVFHWQIQAEKIRARSTSSGYISHHNATGSIPTTPGAIPTTPGATGSIPTTPGAAGSIPTTPGATGSIPTAP